jgi:molecular chaperone GrpE (heat shock protein)
VADYEDRYLGQLEKAIERIERTVERAVDRFQAQTERVEHHIKELHDAQEQRANRLESRFDNLQARMEGRMDQVLWAVIAFAATVLLGLIGEFYANTQVIGSILHHLP